MHIVFRTDASLHIGNGHVMRCLTLAHKLRSAGCMVHFICRERNGDLIAKIREHGFECTALPFQQTIEDETPESTSAFWQQDARETLAAIHHPVDWVVVDHYALEKQWETAIQQHFKNLLVIDDLANRAHTCRILVDHNLGRVTEDYAFWVDSDCTLLLGPQYALIKDEFTYRTRLASSPSHTSDARHLVISMGGVDVRNLTTQILQTLAQVEGAKNFEIRVILGPHSPWNSQVVEEISKTTLNVKIFIDPPSVAALMVDADIAIGTCGVSAIERCSLRVPSINFVVADNQLTSGLALEKSGACHLIRANQLWDVDFMHAFSDLCDATHRQKMQNACVPVVDGQGVQKVVEAMCHDH